MCPCRESTAIFQYAFGNTPACNHWPGSPALRLFAIPGYILHSSQSGARHGNEFRYRYTMTFYLNIFPCFNPMEVFGKMVF